MAICYVVFLSGHMFVVFLMAICWNGGNGYMKCGVSYGHMFVVFLMAIYLWCFLWPYVCTHLHDLQF